MYIINEHIKKKLINKYRGLERKETVILEDGNTYLIKMPDKTEETNRGLSYINNAISEYLGCKIIESIGLDVQEVRLGKYETKSSEGKNKTDIVCICKDFVPLGYALAEAEVATLGSEKTITASFGSIKEISKEIPGISEEELYKFYSKLFIVDALIGNKDRHNGNWGFITGPEYNRIAPIYDCGSSLCPLLEDEELTKERARNMAINAISAITDQGERIHYFKYISSGKNECVTNALQEILPNINLWKINRIIDETPYISDKRKEFYKEFVKNAYENNLLQSLYLIQKQNNQLKIKENHGLDKLSIKEIKKLPLFEKKNLKMNDHTCEAMKVSDKFVLLIENNMAVRIYSIQ